VKILFFCWGTDVRVELFHLSKYFAQYPHLFVMTPLVRKKEELNFAGLLSELARVNKNIIVSPVYLKSPNNQFVNLFNPKILVNDFLSIFKVIQRSKPDVIVCFYILHAFPLVLIKRIFKYSLCAVAMGSDVNIDNSLIQKTVKKIIYSDCELILARSQKLKERIEKERKRPIIVIPSSADISFFKPLNAKSELRRKWGIKPEVQIILTVCRLDKNKGVDVLLKSIKILKSTNVTLMIVGEGVERKALKELSNALKIENNVKFLGFRTREDLLELYNLADLFALASYSEGLPRVLIEAMACGCIPVVTNVGDVATVVRDGFSGYIINPGDYERFAERAKQILSLTEKAKKVIQIRARNSVTNEFDSRVLLNKMVNELTLLKSSTLP
jgi:L-malate glycosyltransferase